VGTSLNGEIQNYGGDYFSFMLVGIALQEYLITPLQLFSRQIRESQLNGTLEALLSTQTSLHAVILSTALYPFTRALLNVALYIGFGLAFFELRITAVNWLGAILTLIFAAAVFTGIGILSASFILIFKRGEPFTWAINSLSWIFAGVLYPVSTLPRWLRGISSLLPIRYAIDAMRGAVLHNASWSELSHSLLPLLACAVIIVPVSLVLFQHANKWVRTVGSLADY
jgi:ABC-2 type transport system permease protein